MKLEMMKYIDRSFVVHPSDKSRIICAQDPRLEVVVTQQAFAQRVVDCLNACRAVVDPQSLRHNVRDPKVWGDLPSNAGEGEY